MNTYEIKMTNRPTIELVASDYVVIPDSGFTHFRQFNESNKTYTNVMTVRNELIEVIRFAPKQQTVIQLTGQYVYDNNGMLRRICL